MRRAIIAEIGETDRNEIAHRHGASIVPGTAPHCFLLICCQRVVLARNVRVGLAPSVAAKGSRQARSVTNQRRIIGPVLRGRELVRKATTRHSQALWKRHRSSCIGLLASLRAAGIRLRPGHHLLHVRCRRLMVHLNDEARKPQVAVGCRERAELGASAQLPPGTSIYQRCSIIEEDPLSDPQT